MSDKSRSSQQTNILSAQDALNPGIDTTSIGENVSFFSSTSVEILAKNPGDPHGGSGQGDKQQVQAA